MCAGSVLAGGAGAALADYRIRKDYGGFIHQYKLKYAAIRDRGERVIIDKCLQLGLHAGARHRPAQADMRHPAREPRLSHGLFR
jgi:hypothetical protein